MATTVVVSGQVPAVSYGVQPQQNIVISNGELHPASKHKEVFRRLGITQIVLGVLSFILGIVMCVILSLLYAGTGIWGGVWYCISGGVNLSIAAKAHKCNVIAGLIVSLMACTLGFVSGVYDALGSSMLSSMFSQYGGRINIIIALYAVLSVLDFVQMVLAIVASAYCCMGTCCQSNVQGRVVGASTVMTTIPAVQHGYGQQQCYVPSSVAQVYTNVAAQQQVPYPNPPAPAYKAT